MGHIAATNKLVTVLALALLTGCGAKKVSNLAGSDAPSSRAPIEDLDSSERPASACNMINENFFKAGTMVFADDNGNIRNEALRIKIESLAPEFSTNDDYFIQFFRWKASGDSPAVIDGSPLEFAFEVSSNREMVQGMTTTLTAEMLRKLATDTKLGSTNITTILGTFNLVLNLKDASGEYDAIKVVAYRKTGAGGTAKVVDGHDGDSLIPAFYADPRQYAYLPDKSRRSDALLSLHPFISSINNNGITAAQYATQARALCWESVY